MPTKKQLKEAERVLKETDWQRYEAMSDGELRAAWAWDSNVVWPTDEELAGFDLVIPAKSRRKPKRAA